MNDNFFYETIHEQSIFEAERKKNTYKDVFEQIEIKDPKTKSIIRFPTHCKSCEPNKLWDFNTYINYFINLDDSSVKCPICYKKINFDDIIIDLEVEAILKSYSIRQENKILFLNRSTKQFFFV